MVPAAADGLDDDCAGGDIAEGAGGDIAEGDDCLGEDGTGDDERALELPVRHCQ